MVVASTALGCRNNTFIQVSFPPIFGFYITFLMHILLDSIGVVAHHSIMSASLVVCGEVRTASIEALGFPFALVKNATTHSFRPSFNAEQPH